MAGNAAAAALLLEQKADVNLANDAGFTPLMAAARLGSGSCVRLLCEHKADVRAELPDGRCGHPACQTLPAKSGCHPFAGWRRPALAPSP